MPTGLNSVCTYLIFKQQAHTESISRSIRSYVPLRDEEEEAEEENEEKKKED